MGEDVCGYGEVHRWNTDIIFSTDDIKASYKELKEQGVRVSKPKKPEWGGWWTEFEDLDGNEYGLAQE